MRAVVLIIIVVVSSLSLSSATFFGSKEKRGLFGFGYNTPAATPVIAVAHHHHHLAYGAPITKVIYTAPQIPYPEPVAKVAIAHHHPIPYDFHAVPHVVQYAAQWPRIVYHHPEALTKLAYAAPPLTKVTYGHQDPLPLNKVAYGHQDPLITKFAYTAPAYKKFGYDIGQHY